MRLRMLRALQEAELSVSELVDVFEAPQSTMSRHLRGLREVHFVESRKDGRIVYYRLGEAGTHGPWASLLETALEDLPDSERDESAVRTVLKKRRVKGKTFFDRMAGEYSRLAEPGGGWQALATGLAVGFAGQDVADLGAGEGELSILLAKCDARVTAVDQSVEMLDELKRRAGEAHCSRRIRRLQGELEKLPLKEASVDVAFMSQSLHHTAQPERALTEATRILRPGGRLVLLDLNRHQQEWMREEWADQWLGFDPALVRTWMSAAGLSDIRDQTLPAGAGEVSILFVTAVKNT